MAFHFGSRIVVIEADDSKSRGNNVSKCMAAQALWNSKSIWCNTDNESVRVSGGDVRSQAVVESQISLISRWSCRLCQEFNKEFQLQGPLMFTSLGHTTSAFSW